jgi:hypothetical protein
VALLAAREGVGNDQLQVIRQVLETRGWQCVPVNVDGRDQLQVTGFNTEQEMTQALVALHATPVTAEVLADPSDHHKKNLNNWAQHNSLKAGGWLNLVGDLTLLISGLHARDPYKIVAGGLYTGGAAVLSRYANVKTERQVNEVLRQTAEQMKQQAVELPPEAGLATILDDHKRGKIHKLEDFLYRYPADVMLSAYTMGAASMLAGGIHARDKLKIGYGVSSLSFKTASLLIPEKKKAEEGAQPPAAADNPIQAVWNWVQEKPLRLMGFGSMVSDTLLGMSAVRDLRGELHKPHELRFKEKGKGKLGLACDIITAGTYLSGDLLIAVSNKKTENADGKFSADEQRRITGMAAEAVAAQPAERREALAVQTASFLARRPEMTGNAAEIARAIKEQAMQQGQNPWAKRIVSSFDETAQQAAR